MMRHNQAISRHCINPAVETKEREGDLVLPLPPLLLNYSLSKSTSTLEIYQIQIICKTCCGTFLGHKSGNLRMQSETHEKCLLSK